MFSVPIGYMGRVMRKAIKTGVLILCMIPTILFYVFSRRERLNIEKKSDFYEGTVQYSEITVNYPQLHYGIDSEKVEIANALIKQAAFSVWGNTYEEAAACLEKWQKDSCRGETVIDYEVTHFS